MKREIRPKGRQRASNRVNPHYDKPPTLPVRWGRYKGRPSYNSPTP